jgi:hypothetical protein
MYKANKLIKMLIKQIEELKEHTCGMLTDILIDYFYETKIQKMQQETFGARMTEDIQEAIVAKAIQIANSFNDTFEKLNGMLNEELKSL